MFGRFRIPWDDIEKELETRVQDVFLKVFETMGDTAKEVEALRKRFPNLNENALAQEIIRETSNRTAVIGGGAALPDLIPGMGWSAMIVTLAGDFAMTLRETMAMFLKFSFLFEPDETEQQRKKDVVSLLVFMSKDSSSAGFARETLDDLQKLKLDVAFRKVFVRAAVHLGIKVMKKKLFAFVPGLGIALSGGVNYLGTRQAGRLGVDYFRNKAEFLRRSGAGAISLETTQKATVQMMVNLIKMGEKSETQLESLEDTMEMFGFKNEIRAEIRSDLQKKEITPIPIKDIKAMSQEDRRYVLKQGLKLAPRPTSKQENYLEFINRAFGLTQVDMKNLRDEVRSENS